MLDINGVPLRPNQLAQLLCEVLEIDDRLGVRVRVLNSSEELQTGCRHDEALGGIVADAELTAFVEGTPVLSSQLPVPSAQDDQADGVK